MAQSNFLVAIDITDEADEVLAAAHKLATELQGKLTAITVIRPLYTVYGDVGMVPYGSGTVGVNFEAEAVAQAKERLKTICAQYSIEPDDIRVELGNPAREIHRVAEEMDTEIIVIGTHGRHGIGLVLGSTANAVLHGVPCDVLAVRIHPVESDAA